MIESKHTPEQPTIEQIAPTPWGPNIISEVIDDAGDLVCECTGTVAEMVLRRDHIIRCVNAHEKLLAALAEVLADTLAHLDAIRHKDQWKGQWVDREFYSAVIARARAAIAAAKE